jgi:hypothetical protein
MPARDGYTPDAPVVQAIDSHPALRNGSRPAVACAPARSQRPRWSRMPSVGTQGPRAQMHLTVPLGAVRRFLAAALALLLVLGVGAEVAIHLLGGADAYGLLHLVDLSYEANVPTWYSSLLLLACAVVLGVITRVEAERPGTPVRHWGALALVFAYLSLDEAVSIHEFLNHLFDFGGVLYFGWVIPVGALVVLVGIVYLPFLARLPGPTRRGVVRAGAVYVTGALGVELALGYWTDLHGEDNLVYGLIDAVEESLEILGASLFLSTLLAHLAARAAEVRVSFRGNGAGG